MSRFIKFYFTSSMLNMFRTLIHSPSGACDFSIVSPHWSCVLVSMSVGVSVWLVGVVSVWQPASSYFCPDSSVSSATCYGLDGPGIESRRGRDFPYPFRPPPGPTEPPIQWLPGFSEGGG